MSQPSPIEKQMNVKSLPEYPCRDKFPWDPIDPDDDRLKKAFVKYYCYHYASWLQADGEEITATSLAEYAVDQLFEHEHFSDHVYDFLDDPDHWVWDVALAAQEAFE